jgi:RHH-type rel operon transcriptional repressor/antitoxin RelB
MRLATLPVFLAVGDGVDDQAVARHTCLAGITGREVSEMPLSISVRLPDKTARALDELANATDRSRTYLIVRALEAYLADHADYQVALDRLRDKDDPVISSGELRRRLGRKD